MTFIPVRPCLNPRRPRFERIRVALSWLTRGFIFPPQPGRCHSCANCEANDFWRGLRNWEP